jgi:Rrf2 family protein
MKLSSQEEYGLRCLIQVARHADGATIPEISSAEGISGAHAAKLLRILRRGGFIKSVRGKVGGYSLSRPASKIVLGDVLDALGGRLYEKGFCESHSGHTGVCRHTSECSVRILWRALQVAVDRVLEKATLQDILQTETQMNDLVTTLSPGTLIAGMFSPTA